METFHTLSTLAAALFRYCLVSSFAQTPQCEAPRNKIGERAAPPFDRAPPLIEGLRTMQVPSILLGKSRTRLLQGIAIGAIASMVIGFSWGGWVTGAPPTNLRLSKLAPQSWQSSRRSAWRSSCRTAMRKQIWQPCEKSLPTGNRASTWRRAVGRHGRGLPPPTTSWPGRVQRN